MQFCASSIKTIFVMCIMKICTVYVYQGSLLEQRINIPQWGSIATNVEHKLKVLLVQFLQ